MFCNGVAVDRVAGFDELGAKDDFATVKLEKRLLQSTVIEEPKKSCDSDEEDRDWERCRNLRSATQDVEDEDSDFD